MKKMIRLSLAVASLAVAGAASAAQPPTSFQTAAGSSFTNYFLITPSVTDKLVISVSGKSEQYSELSFEFLSGGPSAVAALSNGNLVAAFNDRLNNPYSNQFALVGGTTYTLKISGVTKDVPPGTFGLVSISTLAGTVTPVSEPENYAMLLAGLGMMGAIARRRSKTKAV